MNAYARLLLSPVGLINRRDYRHAAIVVAVVNIALWSATGAGGHGRANWLSVFIPFTTFWPSVCVTAKRLRAVGASVYLQAPIRLFESLGLIAEGQYVWIHGEASTGTWISLLMAAALFAFLLDVGVVLWLGVWSPASLPQSPADVFD